ncbi:MAG: glycerol-3-phosphate acyltransferase [Planctomycetia bacterium]|jgi:glycerol-3-phosphate acyltransferase PlsY|nr:glycerol-3-phosphate 1-O-acyltransferase PlsY [Planctomycetota bacterium]
MPQSELVTLLVAAYLVGGIPFGLIIARHRGVDLRKAGSGNVGATNVGRVLGKKWGVLVFILDLGKGALVSIVAAKMASSHSESETMRDWIWLACGASCIVGSVFPVYLRFQGGKGVAASLGVVLGIYPYLTLPGLLALALWVIVVKVSGYVSLASLSAAVFLPLGYTVMAWFAPWPLSVHYPLLALQATLSVLVFIRHRENIRRLLAGTENRIGRTGDGQTKPAS